MKSRRAIKHIRPICPIRPTGRSAVPRSTTAWSRARQEAVRQEAARENRFLTGAALRTNGRPTRAGSTLTEVLVALMIMSIGLVSVAVMFPLSVLRSIKATQFTNATLARYNAEAMIDLYPYIIRNPDLTRFPAGTGPLYPNAWYSSSFIVDPLGYAIIYQTDAAGTYYPYFGNDSSLAAGAWQLKRFTVTPPSLNATVTPSAQAADSIVTLPDQWILQYEKTGSNLQPSTAAATSVDVAGLGATGFVLPTLPAAAPAGTTPPFVRAVIFSGDGVTCQTRTITNVVGNTISWTDALPASFTGNASGIGKVRIEQQDRRYTWLLTVRVDGAGSPSVDVVVFFNRPFDSVTIDETLFPATFISGSYQVVVTYTAGTNPATKLPYKPFMKKGNYIFDANNCYWYRISNVTDNSTTQSTVTLDVPANASNSATLFANPRAMFPRNIVDVYPIGTKSK